VKGFVVLPRRWVVERTFSWFGRNRRLAKDFENLAETLATFVTLASLQIALRRLARAYALTSTMPVGMMAPVPLPAASGCSRIGQPTFAAREAVTQMRRQRPFANCAVAWDR
jgi:hypothetical protein